MPATYLILFALGLGIIWFGLRTKDEVYRLAATITAAILLIWGFVLTPLEFQLVVGILAVVAVFPICTRCINGFLILTQNSSVRYIMQSGRKVIHISVLIKLWR